MNEKIIVKYMEQLGISPWQVYPQDMAKFAELIVKECIRVPYDMWDKAELNADIAVKIDRRIEEHFGVEE